MLADKGRGGGAGAAGGEPEAAISIVFGAEGTGGRQLKVPDHPDAY